MTTTIRTYSSTFNKDSRLRIAMILAVSLFFFWGLTMNLANALNVPFGDYMNLSGAESALLQTAYYGAYFVMAIPAGIIAGWFGYRGGMTCGLLLFSAGAFAVAPATYQESYPLFLFAMFVVASGAATLETCCNPFIAKTGAARDESFRLNLAQSFNGLGNIIAPLILSRILTDVSGNASSESSNADQERIAFLADTRITYCIIGIVLIVLLVLIHLTMPAAARHETQQDKDMLKPSVADVWRRHDVRSGVYAEFIFIGAQVAGMALFPSYVMKHWDGIMTPDKATAMLSLLSVLFTVGRFATVPLMRRIASARILRMYMLLASFLMAVAFIGHGNISVVAYMVAYLFISIGYPTIFSLTLRFVSPEEAKTGSSLLVMSTVGAALAPLVLGQVKDVFGIDNAIMMLVPMLLYVAWYASRQTGMTSA